jgi:hypothetical protein
MKKILLAVIFSALGQMMVAQVIKGKNLPIKNPVVTNIVNQNMVTLYKDVNFGGQSKAFGVGSFALTDSNSLVIW